MRTEQLRCTREETKAFLHQAMGTKFPDDTIQEVTALKKQAGQNLVMHYWTAPLLSRFLLALIILALSAGIPARKYLSAWTLLLIANLNLLTALYRDPFDADIKQPNKAWRRLRAAAKGWKPLDSILDLTNSSGHTNGPSLCADLFPRSL